MRPKKPENEKKTGVVNARLTPEEKSVFIQYCTDNDVKYGRLLRKIIREMVNEQPDLITTEMKDFKDSVKQLAGIARNLNQLTRAVNSGKIPGRLTEQSYWDELNSRVDSLKSSLESVIEMTATRWVRK